MLSRRQLRYTVIIWKSSISGETSYANPNLSLEQHPQRVSLVVKGHLKCQGTAIGYRGPSQSRGFFECLLHTLELRSLKNDVLYVDHRQVIRVSILFLSCVLKLTSVQQ